MRQASDQPVRFVQIEGLGQRAEASLDTGVAEPIGMRDQAILVERRPSSHERCRYLGDAPGMAGEVEAIEEGSLGIADGHLRGADPLVAHAPFEAVRFGHDPDDTISRGPEETTRLGDRDPEPANDGMLEPPVEEGSWSSKMRTYTGPSVLVIDELGYLPMDATSAHWIFGRPGGGPRGRPRS